MKPSLTDNDLFHKFMSDNRWSGAGDKWRYDLLEKRCQRYGDTAIASYTFMLNIATPSDIQHQTHNESRVLVKLDNVWKVVHVASRPPLRRVTLSRFAAKGLYHARLRHPRLSETPA